MKQLAPEFAAQSDTMINNAARIYASAMTEAELKEAAVALAGTWPLKSLGRSFIGCSLETGSS